MSKENYQTWHSHYEMTVQWGDCDPADIVYYPNYYRWMDNASHHMFAQRGFSFDEMRRIYNSLGFPLVSAEATFTAPSRVGDNLTIHSRLASKSKKSVVVEHHVLRDEIVCVMGREIRIMGAKRPEDGVLYGMELPEKFKQSFI